MLTFRVLPHWHITSRTHHMTWHSTQSHYTDTGLTKSAFSMTSAKKTAANTILKVFGMTQQGIEPTTSQTQAGRSSNWATAPVGSKVIGLLILTVFTITEPARDKTNGMTGLPGRHHINMGIRTVWSVVAVHSMGCYVAKVSIALENKELNCRQWTDQTWQMPRLIWISAGCTCHFVDLLAAHICSVAARANVIGPFVAP